MVYQSKNYKISENIWFPKIFEWEKVMVPSESVPGELSNEWECH
jgi:hypothetical protein